MNSTIARTIILTVTILGTPAATLMASDIDGQIETSFSKSYTHTTLLHDDEIKCSSTDGVVLLTGYVTDEFHKVLAQETLASLDGVVKVSNQLRAKNETLEITPEEAIKTKVRGMLAIHRDMDIPKLNVKIRDGTIVLLGQVDNPGQKKLITQYVKSIEGVNAVQNDMTVGVVDDSLFETKSEGIDDASITAQVKLALQYRHSNFAKSLNFKTRSGVVYFSGNNLTTSEKDLIGMLVSGINGVKSMIDTDVGIVAYCTYPDRIHHSIVEQMAVTSAKTKPIVP